MTPEDLPESRDVRGRWRLRTALIALVVTLIGAATYVLTRPEPLLPDAQIVRTTREGIKIRAQYGPESTISDCQQECPPCVISEGVTAVYNDINYGRGTALYASATIPVATMIDAGGGGGPGKPTIDTATVHVTQDVGRVEVRFGGGFTDGMTPIGGWAVLAAYGNYHDHELTVWDRAGKMLVHRSEFEVEKTPCKQ